MGHTGDLTRGRPGSAGDACTLPADLPVSVVALSANVARTRVASTRGSHLRSSGSATVVAGGAPDLVVAGHPTGVPGDQPTADEAGDQTRRCPGSAGDARTRTVDPPVAVAASTSRSTSLRPGPPDGARTRVASTMGSHTQSSGSATVIAGGTQCYHILGLLARKGSAMPRENALPAGSRPRRRRVIRRARGEAAG